MPAGVLFCAMLASAPLQAGEKILGIAELGATTLKEARQAIEERGCFVGEEPHALATLEECLKLPGNPAMILSEDPDTGRTASLVLRYRMSQSTFDKYLKAVQKAHGKPDVLHSPPLGTRLAVWHAGRLFIELSEVYDGFRGDLIYMLVPEGGRGPVHPDPVHPAPEDDLGQL